jgi:hypothetical protein
MNKYKLYFCFLEYFATGEGLAFSVAVVGGKSKKEAKAKFIEKYICNGEYSKEEHKQKCVSYFSHGVSVYDFDNEKEHTKIEGIMNNFFSQGVTKSMLDARKTALMEFCFKMHTNYS